MLWTICANIQFITITHFLHIYINAYCDGPYLFIKYIGKKSYSIMNILTNI